MKFCVGWFKSQLLHYLLVKKTRKPQKPKISTKLTDCLKWYPIAGKVGWNSPQSLIRLVNCSLHGTLKDIEVVNVGDTDGW